MRKDNNFLDARDLLEFVGIQLNELEMDFRRIEGTILAVAQFKSSDRQVIQNLDRCLQVLQDLSMLAKGANEDLEVPRVDAQYLSRHLQLGHLKSRLLKPEADLVEQGGEPDFFD